MTRSPPTAATLDPNRESADAIAEAYAELVAAWPRVEEDRNNRPTGEAPCSRLIRPRTSVK
jgi:hypothetical protein